MTEKKIWVSHMQFQLDGETFATGCLIHGEETDVLRMGSIRYVDVGKDSLIFRRYQDAYLEEEDNYVRLSLRGDRFIISETSHAREFSPHEYLRKGV